MQSREPAYLLQALQMHCVMLSEKARQVMPFKEIVSVYLGIFPEQTQVPVLTAPAPGKHPVARWQTPATPPLWAQLGEVEVMPVARVRHRSTQYPFVQPGRLDEVAMGIVPADRTEVAMVLVAPFVAAGALQGRIQVSMLGGQRRKQVHGRGVRLRRRSLHTG